MFSGKLSDDDFGDNSCKDKGSCQEPKSLEELLDLIETKRRKLHERQKEKAVGSFMKTDDGSIDVVIP